MDGFPASVQWLVHLPPGPDATQESPFKTAGILSGKGPELSAFAAIHPWKLPGYGVRPR